MTNEMDKWHKFVWRIENFSYCWHKKGEYISSPEFYMEGAKWSLRIFPRGSSNSSYIACYLKAASYVDHVVRFELSISDLDGVVLTYWAPAWRPNFTGNTTEGYSLFTVRNDVFADKRTKFLPNDTLTLCCCISNSGRFSGTQKRSARTNIDVNWETITGRIQNFSTVYNSHEIRVSQAADGKSILKINLSVDEGSCCDEMLYIEIFFSKNEERKFSTCSVFLLDNYGIKLKCGKSDVWFLPSKTDQRWIFPLIFTKWEMMAKKDLYLPDDILSLQFECSSSMGISKEITEVSYTEASSSSAYSTNISDGVEESSAVEVLGSLLKENILCDVNLQTNTKTFPAHKAILSARSPVFKAMFTNDLKEKTTNKVDIEDLDDDTVHRFLLYIYTDTVEDLQWQVASQLYVAADKYSVESLKKKCASRLKENLCPSNVCEILELADRHQDAYMKNSVQEYILLHDKSVVQSDEWKDFGVKNPQLAFETICNVFKKAKGF